MQARLEPTVRQLLTSRGYNFYEDKHKGVFEIHI